MTLPDGHGYSKVFDTKDLKYLKTPASLPSVEVSFLRLRRLSNKDFTHLRTPAALPLRVRSSAEDSSLRLRRLSNKDLTYLKTPASLPSRVRSSGEDSSGMGMSLAGSRAGSSVGDI